MFKILFFCAIEKNNKINSNETSPSPLFMDIFHSKTYPGCKICVGRKRRESARNVTANNKLLTNKNGHMYTFFISLTEGEY